jgi:peroxiredoxin
MRPLLAIVIALTLVAVAAAVGLFAGEHRPPGDAASPAPAATVSASAPAKATVAPAAKARAGRVLPLPDAIRELDLIKPARSKRAEDFSLNTPGSGKVRLLDYRGQVVLINFWATWCPPCLEEMPAMERLYRQHRDLGFTLVAVSVDADSKLVAPFVTAHKFTFPVALDPSMSMANTYGVRALPSTFIVARDGTLAALAIGPRHWDNDAAHSLIEGLAR